MSENISSQIGEFVIIPQGENIEKVCNAFDEISDALAIIESKKSVIKDIKKMLKEDYEMTSKSINLMSKLHFSTEANKHFNETEEMQTLYETLFG